MTSSSDTYAEADWVVPNDKRKSSPELSKILAVCDHDEDIDLRSSAARLRRTSTQCTFSVVVILSTAIILSTVLFLSGTLRHSGITIFEAYHKSSLHVTNCGNLPPYHTLPSGDAIPSIAFGTAPSDGSWGKIGNAAKIALQVGYRHLDCAWDYLNEKEVGEAIRESGIPREEIWITSKLWNSFHSPEDVEPALDDTLKKLGTTYLDLYLIHWPVAFSKDLGVDGQVIIDHDLTDDPYPTWRAMETLVEKGKVRNIGVSNFNINRIKNLTGNSLRISPSVNQVELSYWNPQRELVEWSRDNGILLEAYSPLGSSKHVKQSLQVPEVKEISLKLAITPAQVLISWAVQRGTVVIPKSITSSRIKENFCVTRLPENLFTKLDNAASSHPPLRFENPSELWGLGYDIFEWGN